VGWTPWIDDRYPPHSFVPFLLYQGRTNVIGLGINASDGFATRSAPYRSTFYNTQGKGHNSKPDDRVVASSLYIPASWGDPTQGSRRTDIWIEIVPANTDYAIIGFTNYGGPPRYRVWTEDAGGHWIDLTTPVVYDAWTDFRIEYDGSHFKYFINDILIQTTASLVANEVFFDIKLEAYNFTDDPSITGAFAGDPLGNYVAHWTNPTPEVTVRSPCGCSERRQKLYDAFNAVVDFLF